MNEILHSYPFYPCSHQAFLPHKQLDISVSIRLWTNCPSNWLIHENFKVNFYKILSKSNTHRSKHDIDTDTSEQTCFPRNNSIHCELCFPGTYLY